MNNNKKSNLVKEKVAPERGKKRPRMEVLGETLHNKAKHASRTKNLEGGIARQPEKRRRLKIRNSVYNMCEGRD